MQARYLSILISALLCAGVASAAEQTESAKAKTETAAQEAKAKSETAARKGAAKPVPTPKTDAEKKPNVFQRMFGRREKKPVEKATPAPAPTATPRPRRARHEPAEETEKPAEKAPEKPAASEKKAEAAPEKKAESPAPAAKTEPEAKQPPAEKPSTRKGKGKAAATPEAKAKSKEQEALDKAMASGDKDAIERAKYDEVKARAVSDEKIQALKQKAENAPTEEEGRKDLKAYNKALFQKMRSLDPELKGRIDQMDTAVMKQLDGTP